MFREKVELLSKKYNVANFITIAAAQLLYEKCVATIITDGQYIQSERESNNDVLQNEQMSSGQ
jgi:hypothetical protein